MSSPAISVQSISKLYRLQHAAAGSQSFRDLLTGLATAPFKRFRELSGNDRSLEDFWALKDVSFDVREGEVVGIIGRNGAGKSTLLKILSRIVEPTSGEVRMRGRVASLLEVGTGFHPELSGRENIYLNGSILGMKRREIDARFDEIVEFAEIEKFLDTPVKRYSSGMYVRLAFAVAAHLDPEILIVDEVLAVGDAEFQKKCLGKMKEVSAGGHRTVLFVSHNMAAVSALCNRVVLLASGKLVADGEPSSVMAQYMIPLAKDRTGDVDTREHPGRQAGCEPAIFRVRSLSAGQLVTSVTPLQEVLVEITIRLPAQIRSPRVSMAFDNARGERTFALATFLSPDQPGHVGPLSIVRVQFAFPALFPGRYDFEITLTDQHGVVVDRIDHVSSFDVAQGAYLGSTHAYFPEMGIVLVPSTWSAEAGGL